MTIMLWRLCLLLVLQVIFALCYTVPEPTIKLLEPKGFSVSIPDSPGIRLFAFHGNLNHPLREVQAGQWNTDIVKAKNGYWTYKQMDVELKPGDVIHYWLFVDVDGVGYQKLNQQWIVNTHEENPETPTRVGEYEVPEPKLEALTPTGIRVSIPDDPQIQLFAFHGNINKPLTHDLEAGVMSRDILRPKDGRWVFEDKSIRLKEGDVVYFWLYVQVDGRGYQKLNQKWVVPGSGLEETFEQPSAIHFPASDFTLPEGTELEVVVRGGKLVVKNPLPPHIKFQDDQISQLNYCKTMQICLPTK